MLDATQLLWTQIAAGVCALIFAGQVYNLLRLRSLMEASKAWITIGGEIITSEAKLPPSHTSDDQDDVDAIVRYRYRVGGQNYESDRIKIGGQASMTRAFADAVVAKYPVGAHVDVHYDPHDPENVALEPRKQDNLVVRLVFAIVFGGVGGILALHAITGKVPYTDNGVPLFAFALPIVAFLLAGFSVVAFVRGRRQASASAHWPTVSGRITTSDIIEESRTRGMTTPTPGSTRSFASPNAIASICVSPIGSGSATLSAPPGLGAGPRSSAAANSPRR